MTEGPFRPEPFVNPVQSPDDVLGPRLSGVSQQFDPVFSPWWSLVSSDLGFFVTHPGPPLLLPRTRSPVSLILGVINWGVSRPPDNRGTQTVVQSYLWDPIVTSPIQVERSGTGGAPGVHKPLKSPQGSDVCKEGTSVIRLRVRPSTSHANGKGKRSGVLGLLEFLV